MALTPAQRVMRARIAAAERWSRTTAAQRVAATAPGRLAAAERFLAQVDAENPGLPEHERQRLAALKLSAHMTRLALASSKARGIRRTAGPML